MPQEPTTPRIALVTGGAGGIGRAIVEELAAQGHRVAVGDIIEETAVELAIRLDVIDAGSVDQAIAQEVARSGVTATSVCPGPTETPMLDQVAAATPDSARTIEAMVRAVPMRRLGQPEDVAAAVAFLASERAGFITGQTLSVSGGLTMA